MRRWAWLLAMAMVVGCGLTVAAPASGRRTANEQFYEAYSQLIKADIARDEERLTEALVIYKQCRDLYVQLMKDYPDWEPAATRFRLTRCSKEIDRLESVVRDDKRAAVANAASGRQAGLRAVKAKACALMEDEDPEEARTVLLAALKQTPDDTGLRILLGIAQCRLGRFRDAQSLMQSLLADFPDNAVAQTVLGSALFGLGRHADAATALKRALSADPTQQEAHYNLAQVMLAMDPPDNDAADFYYRKALALGGQPDSLLERRVRELKAAEAAAGDTPASRRVAPAELPTDAEGVAAPATPGDEAAGEVPAVPKKKSWLRSIAPW